MAPKLLLFKRPASKEVMTILKTKPAAATSSDEEEGSAGIGKATAHYKAPDDEEDDGDDDEAGDKRSTGACSSKGGKAKVSSMAKRFLKLEKQKGLKRKRGDDDGDDEEGAKSKKGKGEGGTGEIDFENLVAETKRDTVSCQAMHQDLKELGAKANSYYTYSQDVPGL